MNCYSSLLMRHIRLICILSVCILFFTVCNRKQGTLKSSRKIPKRIRLYYRVKSGKEVIMGPDISSESGGTSRKWWNLNWQWSGGARKNSINIIWEVGEYNLPSLGVKEGTDPTVIEDMICLYLLTSHENQIVALLILVVVSWDTTIVDLDFSCTV